MDATAVILCAGASLRMGTPKGLLPLEGRPLLLRHVEAFCSAGLPVRVVLGAHEGAYRALLPPQVEVRVNAEWERSDPAASAWIGIHDAAVAIVSPVDVPPAAPETLATLLRPGGDAVPSFGGRAGHPVRLVAPHRAGRLDHRLADAERRPVDDPGVLVDFDTPAAWSAWLQSRRRNP